MWLEISGDVNPGPGHCSVCSKQIACNHRAINCNTCESWCHIKCGGVTLKEYKKLQSTAYFSWSCPACLLSLQSLPFANVSNLAEGLAYDQDPDADGSVGTNSVDLNSSTVEDSLPLLSRCDIFQTYSRNFKLAHVNANSVAGFKMQEIKLWLHKETFDVLVITKTKLDDTFPDALFTIDGYKFIRRDRNIHGGGILIYWRSDLVFQCIKSAPLLSSIEAILL